MMRHQLSLEVPSVVNKRILRIIDTSHYNDHLLVECSALEITVPGMATSAAIDVTPGFIANLTACDLALQHKGCADDTHNLPDGIYVIRYSVAPKDKVFVEYNHLRLTASYNRYYTIAGSLNLGECLPDQDTNELLKQLLLVRGFLDAAKAKVEHTHEPLKGMELFRYAVRLLDKINTCSIC